MGSTDGTITSYKVAFTVKSIVLSTLGQRDSAGWQPNSGKGGCGLGRKLGQNSNGFFMDVAKQHDVSEGDRLTSQLS